MYILSIFTLKVIVMMVCRDVLVRWVIKDQRVKKEDMVHLGFLDPMENMGQMVRLAHQIIIGPPLESG